MALQLSVIQQSKQVINLDARGVLTQMEELPFTEVSGTKCIIRLIKFNRVLVVCVCLSLSLSLSLTHTHLLSMFHIHLTHGHRL